MATHVCSPQNEDTEENNWGKGDEVPGEWRKLHNEELNDPYSSPNIVRVMISRRMRWTGM
jgi:hypothetical protein